MKERYFLSQSFLGFHRIHYTEFGRHSEKPPVLCVHGLTRNGRDFDKLALHLAAQGRHVFCLDMVGRGKSDGLANPMLYNYPQYLVDITAQMARMGAEKIDWVGTSMGGLIGMIVASQMRSPIRRLILNDVGPYLPVETVQKMARYVGQDVKFKNMAELERHVRHIYAPFGPMTDEDWHHLAKFTARKIDKSEIRQAHDPAIAKSLESLLTDVDMWPYYDKIRVPTMVLHGACSEILPQSLADEMTRRGPRAKLVNIPNVGHTPALVDDFQIQTVADFLS